MSHPLRIAAVEPYFGGSHRHFLLGLQRHSTHDMQLFTMPPRMWKWRMRGAALHLARALNAAAAKRGAFDVLFCSDFVNVPDLRALLPPALRTCPIALYMHENQLGYPLSPDEDFDPYFGFTNVISCLSAEAVVFNSEFHRRDFLARLPKFLPRLPDYDRSWVLDTIARRAEVLPVGLDLAELDAQRPHDSPHDDSPVRRQPARILWNHRWEFDKGPERFFGALRTLTERNVPFIVDVAGESFERRPEIFDTARAELGERVGQFGMIEDRVDYVRALWSADIVVSTSHQEYFGISMAEAVCCGAWPIAPRALVYEDLYRTADGAHLYADDRELVRLLERACTTSPLVPPAALRDRLEAFDWRRLAPQFDRRFAALQQDSEPLGAPRASVDD